MGRLEPLSSAAPPGLVSGPQENPRATRRSPTQQTRIQDLIGIAVKRHREGAVPKMHVGCRPDNSLWLFWAKDDGIDAKPEFHEKAFLIFQRLDGREQYPGTGTGLAICKEIVEQNGGEDPDRIEGRRRQHILLHSAPGKWPMNTVVNDSLVMLVVEDNPADVVFLQEAVEAMRLPSAMHVVGDGSAALKFLRRQPPFADAPRPDVVVLDLNLPIKNGQEVIEEMAPDPSLNTIPVAVLTTSTSETFVCDLYPRGRCLYFTKTDEFAALQTIVRKIAAHAHPENNSGSD